MCSLQSLPPPGSVLASFPTATAPEDLSQSHSPGNGDIGAQTGTSAQRWSHVPPHCTLGCPFPPAPLWSHPCPASWYCAKGRLWQGLLFIFIIIIPPQTQAQALEGGRRARGGLLCAGAEGCACPWGVDVLPWVDFGTCLAGFSQPWGSRCAHFFHPSHPRVPAAHPRLEQHHEHCDNSPLGVSSSEPLSPLQSTPSRTWCS